MPQPLSKVCSDANVTLSPGNLYKKPALASAVCNAVALSANIDLELSLLLVHILGTEATAALAIYDALLTDKLKMQALPAATRATLAGQRYRVFNAVIVIASAAQNDRHRLAHWIWAHCKELPDAILLADPKHLRWQQIERGKPYRPQDLANALTYDWQAHYKEQDKLLELNKRHIQVYTAKDLDRVCRDLVEVRDAFFYFRFYVQPMKWNRGKMPAFVKGLNTSAGALRRLKTLHLFQEAHRPSTRSKKRRRNKRRK